MQISGTITDTDGRPVADASVELAADGVRFAVVYTDERGHFTHTDTASRIGEDLALRVEKSGYASRELTRPITGDTMTDLTMELGPPPPPPWRRIAIIGVAAVLILAVIIGVVLILTGRSRDPDPTRPQRPPVERDPAEPVEPDREEPEPEDPDPETEFEPTPDPVPEPVPEPIPEPTPIPEPEPLPPADPADPDTPPRERQ